LIAPSFSFDFCLRITTLCLYSSAITFKRQQPKWKNLKLFCDTRASELKREGVLKLEEDKKAPVKLSVYVDRETRTRLKIFCAKQEISMNQAINQMLDEWLHKQDESNKQDPTTSSNAKGGGRKVKDE